MLALVFLHLCHIGHAEEQKDYLVVSSPYTGLFSIFNCVAGLLDAYEEGELAGFELAFYEGFYVQTPGSNWWDYYCTSSVVGSPSNGSMREMAEPEYADYVHRTEFGLSRERVFDLIQKYIHFQAHIKQRVENFIAEQFKGEVVIGLHYRGTDKNSEAPPVPYEQVFEKIQQQIQEQQLREFQIFVATDEQSFLEFMQTQFPDRVIAISMARSCNHWPLHIGNPTPGRQGEDAIVDALLLSRCDLLIRTSSNLSLWSTFFNPKIPVINLNQRYES